MGTYGRNFEFRTPPVGRERQGRFYLDEASPIPIGAPVVVADAATPDDDLTGALPATLATGAQDVPKIGGIAVYEHAPTRPAFAGRDASLDTYSDLDTVPVSGNPLSRMFQIVRGEGIKVVLRNTEDRTFLNVRDYEGRIMVAGLGATPTLAVGDYLTPGVGDDDSGYWTETATASEGWLVIELVDADRSEVEARLTF